MYVTLVPNPFYVYLTFFIFFVGGGAIFSSSEGDDWSLFADAQTLLPVPAPSEVMYGFRANYLGGVEK